MTSIIQALAQMGQDASLQNDSAIEQWLTTTGLDEQLATAIVNKDIITLERQLDVCPDVVCIILSPDEDDDENEDEDDSTEETNQRAVGL